MSLARELTGAKRSSSRAAAPLPNLPSSVPPTPSSFGGTASLHAPTAGADGDGDKGASLSALEAATAPRPWWFEDLAPLAHARAPLPDLVCSLHTLLQSHRACLVVGPAGCGKSSVWRALVAATAGPQALAAQPQLQQPQVVHLYPEALLPDLQAQCATAGGSNGHDEEDEQAGGASSSAQWLLRQLHGSQRWALRRQAEGASVQGGSAGMVSGCPRWVVLDGPLGTPIADLLAGLMVAPAMVYPPGGASVVELSDACHVLWETGSLATASPALLAAVPVLHVADDLWDDEAGLLTAINTLVAEQGWVGVGPRTWGMGRGAWGIGMCGRAQWRQALLGLTMRGRRAPCATDSSALRAMPAAC